MGSVNQALEEVVDYLNKKGEKVGLIKVHLYRPFSLNIFLMLCQKVFKNSSIRSHERAR